MGLSRFYSEIREEGVWEKVAPRDIQAELDWVASTILSEVWLVPVMWEDGSYGCTGVFEEPLSNPLRRHYKRIISWEMIDEASKNKMPYGMPPKPPGYGNDG